MRYAASKPVMPGAIADKLAAHLDGGFLQHHLPHVLHRYLVSAMSGTIVLLHRFTSWTTKKQH
jgi:hypothetical protein